MQASLRIRVVLAAAAWAGAVGAQAPEAVPVACEDFYRHANADWLADPAAPSSPFALLRERSLQRQRELLDALATDSSEAVDRQLAAFWRAANAPADAGAGTGPLQPWLQRIEAMRKPADVAELLAAAHATGLPLLFRFDVGADLREPTRTVIYARQAGLGLPDRDYYLRNDPSTEALRTHYRAYVGRLLALSGVPQERVEAQVAATLDIETRLARASLSLVQLRDPNNSWLPSELRDLDARYDSLDWNGFLRAQGLRKLRGLSLAHTAFFVEADHLVGALPVAQWKGYLRFHALHALAPYLGAPYREARFALFDRHLGGQQDPAEGWRSALQAVDGALGEWLGQRYADRYLGEADAARARAVATAVRDALRDRLRQADWLEPSSRDAGVAKAEAMQVVIGHQDAAPEAALPTLSSTDHAANMMAIAAWRQKAALARLGEAPAPAPLRGHHVNAFYDAAANRLAVSAALLSPPLLPEQADPASAFGGLGALLGHELNHAVDARGAATGAQGEATTWWTAADFQAFTERTRGLVEQYASYPALADVKVDGRRTWVENVADLAGLELAWHAWNAAAPEQGHAPADAQRFFDAYAQLWRQRLDPAQQRIALATAVHAPARWRVLGPLANFAPFASTYDCSAGNGFVRAPDARIRIWE